MTLPHRFPTLEDFTDDVLDVRAGRLRQEALLMDAHLMYTRACRQCAGEA